MPVTMVGMDTVEEVEDQDDGSGGGGGQLSDRFGYSSSTLLAINTIEKAAVSEAAAKIAALERVLQKAVGEKTIDKYAFAENSSLVKLLEKIAPQMDVGDFSVTAAHTITDVSLKAVVVQIAADLHLEV